VLALRFVEFRQVVEYGGHAGVLRTDGLFPDRQRPLVKGVLGWIREGAPLPTTVRDSNFNPDRLLTLRTRNSAAYKGIYALLIQNGGREFLTDEPISLNNVRGREDRHPPHISKAAISSRTNRIIGGVAPSKYLRSLEKRGEICTSKMDHILVTHLIVAGTLRADNFEAFFEARRHSN